MDKPFNVESGLISKLLETKDMLEVKESQIKPTYFTGEHRRAFQYIFDSVISDGEVPTVRAFERKFPGYPLESVVVNGAEIVGTEESLKFWCNELRKKVKHNSLAQTMEDVVKKIEDFDTDEAYSMLKKEIAYIEGEVEEQTSCDITKNTEDRIQAYLKKKENKGMLGLPYGIKHLDYITKGLKKETLTVLIAQTGVGKATTLDTPVLTRNGFVPMREINVGTEVFARDGKYYHVTAVYPQGKKTVYRVSFEDGTYVDCCKEHLWVYKTIDDVARHNDWRVDTLENIMNNHPIKRYRGYNISIPVSAPIQFDKSELPLDPYVLGSLLGDGGFTTDRISFATIDEKMVDKLNSRLSNFNGAFIRNDHNLQYLFKSNDMRENKLYRCIQSLDLQGTNSATKFIPKMYLTASVEDRKELVRGLVDTDGTVTSRGFIVYHTGSKQMCDDFAYLIRSLGYRCRVRVYNRNAKNLPEYKVFVSAKTDDLFSSEHRKEQFSRSYVSKRENHFDLLKIINIEVLNAEEEMQCISVDSPDHTFICGDFIVTHNTWFEILIGAYCQLQNCKVLQFVTEMSEEIMRDRYEAMLFSMMYGELNYNNFKSGALSIEQERQYFEFLENDLPNCEPLIIATASGVMGVSAEIDKHKPDVVLIDGVYLMEDDQGAKDDWLRVAHITRDLKKLAKRCKLPLFINTQADKNTSKKTGPELGSIMYTQSIGQDADDVMALYRDEVMISDREMCVKVLKQREGVLGKVMMNWDFDSMNFSEIYAETNDVNFTDDGKPVEAKNVIGIENIE